MSSKATFRAVVARVLTVRDEVGGREASGTAFHSTGNLPREFGAGEEVLLREVTADEIRSDRQLAYWFVAVVPTVMACWFKERGVKYTKLQVHGILMAHFGVEDGEQPVLVDTPLGPTYSNYPSSRFKSRKQFAQITEGVREWVANRYPGVRIPTPDEWNGEEAA
jgi:hypothetical protein